MLTHIENAINPESQFNNLLDKFEARKDEIVYSHNDFHSSNILKSAENPEKFYAIDFDYSCFNILGHDIAHLISFDVNPQKTENPEDIFKYHP